MNHTKEPWFYQERADAYTHIVRPESAPGMIVCDTPQDSSGKAEANARRIVACVNALAGVPTEWLKGFTLNRVDSVVQENAQLRQQRDDLLAALKDIMMWIKSWDPDFTMDAEWPADRDRAEVAIARAEGREVRG